MKIGILSLPLHTNYGGILQAWALQTVLERMGHGVVFLDAPLYPVSAKIWMQPYYFARRVANKMLGRYKGPLFMYNRRKQIRFENQHTCLFIQKYIHRVVIRQLTLANNLGLDAIVVGSDQVWRPMYFRFFWNSGMQDAMCAFCDNKKIIKVAYAASFGSDECEFTPQELSDCTRLIREFKAVSTREFSGVEFCRKFLGYNNALQVLDPTMLISRDDYIHFFEVANTPLSKGDLLNYILDETPSKNSVIEKLKKKYKLKPFRVNSRVEDPSAPISERCQPPVEDWLRGFYDAKMVVTDSFHACVFSIIFNKPFVVIGNKKRGLSRFITLLQTYGLEKCLITDTTDFNIENLNFDWNYINKIREDKTDECIEFLRTSLSS